MSGLSRTPGKRVWVNSPPRVRIPPAPPESKKPAHVQAFFRLFISKRVQHTLRNQPPASGGRPISEPQRSVNARHLCRCTRSKRRS